MAIRIALPLSLGIVPMRADAGILSIVTGLFNNQAVAAEGDINSNSQKMPLLEAPFTAESVSSSISTTTQILPTDNNALVSNLNDANVVSSSTNKVVLDSNLVIQKSDTQKDKITSYKVKTGDTVSSIAKNFDISTKTVIWANNLKKNGKLIIGQNLVILPISGAYHKVVTGDTLESIALANKGSVDDIIAYNNLDSDVLKIGQIILIPDGEPTDTTTTTDAKTDTKNIPINKAETIKTTTKLSIAKKVASVALGLNIAQADAVDSSLDSNNTSYYMRPIRGGVRTQGIHGYNAVDLADSCGTPIYAAASGEVVVNKNDNSWDGGYGNYIVISHNNGSQTLYAHLTNSEVTEGAHVQKGQVIGSVGISGKATGCHVHFEIRNGPANPF